MSTSSSTPSAEDAKRLFAQFVSEFSKLKEQDRQHVHQGIERVSTVMAVAEACDKTLNDLKEPYNETQRLMTEVGNMGDSTTMVINKVLEDQLICEKLRAELVEQMVTFETGMKTLEREHEHGARMMEFAERVEMQFSVLEEHSAQHAAALETVKAKLSNNKSKLQDATDEIDLVKQKVAAEEAQIATLEGQYASAKQAADAVLAKEVELQNSVNNAAAKAKDIQLQIDQKREALTAHKAEVERITAEGEVARKKAKEEHLKAVSHAQAEMKELDEQTEKLIAELSEISASTEAKLNKLDKKKAELAEKEKLYQAHKSELEDIMDRYNREFGDAKIAVSATVDDSGAIDFYF
uniref:FAM184 domain-containing protein n=1 Tax=Panagrellus redivivus TaxID=6233 RepID=A0A7E4ULH4_PANRE